jgi:hypothetical protein
MGSATPPVNPTRPVPSRLALALALALGAGCLPGVPLELPPLPDGARHVLAYEDAEGVHAAFLPSDARSIAVPAGPAWLGQFPFTPESLDLAAGLDLAALLLEASQPLPAPAAAWSVEALGAPWQPAETSAGPWARLRVPRIAIEACLERGGCISPDEPWRCNLPCVTAAPAPPEPPRFTCPAGWRAVEDAGSGLRPCLPDLPARVACPEGQRQPPFGAACEALHPCPSAPGFPPAPGGAFALYVDPAAPEGGDGSMAQPWRDLAVAVAAAPDGATLLLAAGHLAGGATVVGKALRLVGRCPAETRIEAAGAALVCRDGQVELTGLSLSTAGAGPTLALTRCAATLEGVTAEGLGAGLVLEGGRVEAAHLQTRGAVGIVAHDAAVTVTGWDHEGGGGLDAVGGAVTVADAWLHAATSTTQAALRLVGVSTTSAARLRASGTFALGVDVRSSLQRLELQDVAMEGVEDGVQLRVTDMVAGDPQPLLRLFRVAISARRRGIAMAAVNTEAEDLVLKVEQDVALDVPQLSPWSTQLTIRRLWATSSGDKVVQLGGDEEPELKTDVLGEDWLLGPGPDARIEHSLRTRRDQRVVLRRAHITGGRDYAFFVRCSRAELEDVTMVGGRLAAILIQAQERSTFKRVRITGSGETRVLVAKAVGDCNAAPVVMEDLAVEGCVGCLRGLAAFKATELTVRDVRVEGFGIGAELEAGGLLTVEQGEVVGNSVGFQLPAPRDAEVVVRGVRIDNGRNFSFGRP